KPRQEPDEFAELFKLRLVERFALARDCRRHANRLAALILQWEMHDRPNAWPCRVFTGDAAGNRRLQGNGAVVSTTPTRNPGTEMLVIVASRIDRNFVAVAARRMHDNCRVVRVESPGDHARGLPKRALKFWQSTCRGDGGPRRAGISKRGEAACAHRYPFQQRLPRRRQNAPSRSRIRGKS